jgi:hypothetical protein
MQIHTTSPKCHRTSYCALDFGNGCAYRSRVGHRFGSIFSKSASVATKKSGVMFAKEKLSNHTASSGLNACKADLSKMVMGPTLTAKWG